MIAAAPRASSGPARDRGRSAATQAPEAVALADIEGTERLWTYSNERPNMGIGGLTPAMKLKMAV